MTATGPVENERRFRPAPLVASEVEGNPHSPRLRSIRAGLVLAPVALVFPGTLPAQAREQGTVLMSETPDCRVSRILANRITEIKIVARRPGAAMTN